MRNAGSARAVSEGSFVRIEIELVILSVVVIDAENDVLDVRVEPSELIHQSRAVAELERWRGLSNCVARTAACDERAAKNDDEKASTQNHAILHRERLPLSEGRFCSETFFGEE